MKKHYKRKAAFLLSALLAAEILAGGELSGLGGLLGARTSYAQGETVTISTPQDFRDFSEQCRFDTYSAGKVFELAADLDLTGISCPPVPAFGGTFKGNGHTIRGWSYDTPGSDVGLFRFVEPGGVIENLTVEITMKPEGLRERVGGLAGTNRGQIRGCTVTGTVHGKRGTGGIAGMNESTGLIENSENRAAVTGLENTGGIAGENEGIVENCVNRGPVNTTDVAVDEETEMTEQIRLGGRLLEAEKVYHTGGIAGRSKGILRGCSNEAVIGYPHAGYNTGGIVGMQNGCVYQCVNRGEIRGRKDTGGIVGQFEPYIQISYEEDTLQQVQNQMNTLIDQMDALGNMLGDTGDEAVAELDSLRTALKGIRSSIQSDKSYYFDNTKNFSQDLSASLDSLQESVDQIDLQIETGSLGADIRKIRNQERSLEQLRKELPEALLRDPQRAKQILNSMETAAGTIVDTIRQMPNSMDDDLQDTQDNLNGQLDEVSRRADDARTLVKDQKDSLFDDLENTDSNYEPQFDSVSGQLDALFNTLSSVNASTQTHVEAIRNQIRQIHETIDGGADRIKDLKDQDFVDDVSEADAADMGSGRVLECVNEGFIHSDNNVGGIAGIIGLELGMDPEQDIDVNGDYSLRIDRTSRATIQGAVNHGDVDSQNHYAGGIVGRADAGAVLRNQNYGFIKTVDGDYTGGIAGSSANLVKGNYSLCRLSGNNYIGGIVGKGEDVTGNCAVAAVSGGSGEYRGAVAGEAAGDQVSGNWFVWDGLPAVNGVTYQAQAAAVSYEELLSREGTPNAFGHLRVKFVAEGEEVKELEVLRELEVPYLQPVPEDQIPPVPPREGFYGQWEREGMDGVRCNMTIRAVYRPWSSTIAGYTPGDQVLPRLLLEGDFHPQAQVNVQIWEEGKDPVPDDLLETLPDGSKDWGGLGIAGYRAKRICRFTVDSPIGHTWSGLQARILTKDWKFSRPAAVAVQTEDGFRLLDSVPDGSYQLFAMEDAGTFLVLEKEGSIYPLLGAAALALLAAGYWTRKKKRDRMTGKKHSEEKGGAADHG